MLRLPHFHYHRPRNLPEVLQLLNRLKKCGETFKILAGGTDLLPNMKNGLVAPGHLISLKDIPLRGIHLGQDHISIGAGTSLQEIADSEPVQAYLPALAQACCQIASPQIRTRATLGGNICLETRCVYLNRSQFWRSALGFCLRKDGTVCHVVPGGQRCVAAASNDSALPLMLYGAGLLLRSEHQRRLVPLRDFYRGDGACNKVLLPGEILTEVRIPLPASGISCRFEKLRLRRGIDFPLLNLAGFIERNRSGRILQLNIVVGVLGARPKYLSFSEALHRKKLDRSIIQWVAAQSYTHCHPLTNVAADPQWRREMVKVLVQRVLAVEMV